MMEPLPEVSVSVVSGGEEADLKRFLASISKASQRFAVKVFVVDNQAPFSVVSVVREVCPQAQIIQNQTPKGYGANHNQVFRQVETEFILISNDDVELGALCLDQLVDYACANPDVGCVVPTLYLHDWQTQPMLGGGRLKRRMPIPLAVCMYMFLFELGLGSSLDRFYTKRFKHSRRRNDASELAYATGACCLIRRKVIQKTGGFDENFYMYLEDIDFGLRARQAGFRCVQIAQAKALHVGEKTVGPKGWDYMRRSLPYFTRKYHGFFLQATVGFFILVIDCVHSVKKWGRSTEQCSH